MKPQRAALLLAAHALARDESPGEGLRALSSDSARWAASSLEAGALGEGLRHLGLDAALSGVVARWPKALGPVLRRFDRLPSVNHFRVHLTETLGYFFLVLSVQAGVNAVLSAKVLPIFTQMGKGVADGFFTDLSAFVGGLVTLLLLPLSLWVLLGASGWARLPGWGRHFARAREAAQALALAETGAPEDVRAHVMQGFVVLRDPASSAAALEDLFLEACVEAERALQRFLVAVRVVGFTVLTLLALAMVLSIYGTVSRLPWLS